MNRPILAFVIVGAMLAAARCLTGCLTDEMHKDVAGGLFAAQQAACIDKYADRPSIDKCRDEVKRKWALDAGQEAGQ
jgi:hypothetical protein